MKIHIYVILYLNFKASFSTINLVVESLREFKDVKILRYIYSLATHKFDKINCVGQRVRNI
jgi:hypothetical protein